MAFNIFIYMGAGLVFGWNKAMYSILTCFIAFRVIDVVLEGLNSSKSIRIISDKAYEIGQELIESLDIGVTYLNGIGGFSGAEKQLSIALRRVLKCQKLKKQLKILTLPHLCLSLMFTKLTA